MSELSQGSESSNKWTQTVSAYPNGLLVDMVYAGPDSEEQAALFADSFLNPNAHNSAWLEVKPDGTLRAGCVIEARPEAMDPAYLKGFFESFGLVNSK
jgi:hypothetical protein